MSSLFFAVHVCVCFSSLRPIRFISIAHTHNHKHKRPRRCSRIAYLRYVSPMCASLLQTVVVSVDAAAVRPPTLENRLTHKHTHRSLVGGGFADYAGARPKRQQRFASPQCVPVVPQLCSRSHVFDTPPAVGSLFVRCRPVVLQTNSHCVRHA